MQGKNKCKRVLEPQKEKNYYIGKVEMIELEEGEIHRREEKIARLIFVAAWRKFKNGQCISLYPNSTNLSPNLKKGLTIKENQHNY